MEAQDRTRWHMNAHILCFWHPFFCVFVCSWCPVTPSWPDKSRIEVRCVIPGGLSFFVAQVNFFPSEDVVICFHWWTTSQWWKKRKKEKKAFSTGVAQHGAEADLHFEGGNTSSNSDLLPACGSRKKCLNMHVCECACVHGHLFFSGCGTWRVNNVFAVLALIFSYNICSYGHSRQKCK